MTAGTSSKRAGGHPRAKFSAEMVLTARQREILTLYVSGYSEKDMSAVCGIAHKTVEGHLQNLRARLGIYSRPALVAYYRVNISNLIPF